jgi:hypothetical protein
MKMFHKTLGCSTAVVAALVINASTTQAQNLLTDPNFAGPFTANPITPTSGGVNNGWAVYGQAGSSDMSSAQSSPYGTAATALLTDNTTWNGAGGYQIITPTIQVGATYTFSLFALTDNGFTSYATPLALDLNFVGPWDPTLNGGTGGYPSLSGAAITESANNNQFVNQPGLNTWTEFSVSMSTTDATGIYGIVIQPQTINGSGDPVGFVQDIYFDNALLTVAPAPEPSTLALAGLGGAGLLSLIRRRKS